MLKCGYCNAIFSAERDGNVQNVTINNYYNQYDGPQRQAAPGPQPVQFTVANTISPKSRTVALVLCIFLGTIGAHYFYAGRVGMGILYIFTCGLFGIGWFVDVIRILMGSFPDMNSNFITQW
ncbi:MAG: TM2 domain-containing protein [Eubacterium sp.]|nr:TM2 domain-containing protein [Eubacterium sp.]